MEPTDVTHRSPDPRPEPGAGSTVDRLLEERERLFAGRPSRQAASDYARLLDHAVRELAATAARAADPGKPWAVVALGGYGAGRLLPHSDVDLLVATEARPDRLKPFVKALLYPLWDAGLTVGHSVRGRRDAIAAAQDDLANLTALLTARLLAGSQESYEHVVGAVCERSRRDRASVLPRLARRPRPGSPFDLWPDLKEGRGGQRDLDELVWSAATLSGLPSAPLAALSGEGALDDSLLPELEAAQDTLTTARWVTHLARGRGHNTWDEEAHVAAPAVTAALADALAAVDEATTGCRERLRPRSATRGERAARAAAATGRAAALATDPATALAAFAGGSAAAPALGLAAWRGVFDGPIPGFSALMTLRRPALTHSSTVGAHSVLAATLVAEAAASDARAAAVLAGLRSTEPLVVAALTHDIGKRTGEADHGLAGAPVAREAALKFGLTGPQAAEVGALVRHHLVLAETVAAADIDSEDVVLEVASRLADPDLVGPLYVLTLVDSLATSPRAWTEWKAALTGELAGKVERLLTGFPATDVAARATVRRAEVEELARYEQVPAAVAGFARRAPLRYLAEHPADEVIAHGRLAFTLAQGSRTDSARMEVRPSSLPGTWRVTFVALDRPGLLALLAGVVALNGLDILAVSAHTTGLGVALDTFTVTGATLADVGPETWSRLERALDTAMAGRLEVGLRLAERRHHYRASERKVDASVTIGAPGDFTTAVTVRGSDRVGLLHDLALAMASAGMDIRSVTASTAEGVVRDTFQIVDGSGGAPRDPARLESLRGSLLRAVVGNPSGDTLATEERP